MTSRVSLGTGICLILFVFIALSSVACAHQPRIVWNTDSSVNDPIVVNDPGVSKAYYGELRGKPDYYLVNSSVPFIFYVNILVPNISGYDKRDFLVEVTNSTGRVLLLDGSHYQWTGFFEEFGRDNYLKGPEERMNLSAGSYLIKVYSPVNTGRYSLAIGETESFPIEEIAKALIVLPELKEHFFGRPAYEALFTLYGLGFTMLVLFVLLLLFIMSRFGRSMRNRPRF